jgi:TolB-like protein
MQKRFAAALLLLLGWCAAATAEPPRLLVLPFELSAAQPQEYLKRAVPDVLANRIGQSRDVVVVPADVPAEALAGRSPFSASVAQELGKAQRADYVLSGRVSEIGKRFSVDAALFDVKSGQLVERYSAEGADLSELIPKLGEIGQAVRQSFAARASAAPPVAAAPPPSVQPPAPVAQSAPARKTWVSKALPIEIRGIAVGPVIERGRPDIVLLTRQELQIYRRRGEDLELVARYGATRSAENIGVDVADLDGDGLAEIYVTAAAPSNALASYVLRWNGSALQPLATTLPWHLRLAQLADGPALLGQGRSFDNLFDGPIRRLAWRDGKLVPGAALPLPGHVTLYSFVVADLNGDGKTEVVSLQSRSALKVYDLQGRVLAYGAKYGQSAVYVEDKRANNDGQPEQAQLPGRLRAVTLPGNGLGLLAAQNQESIGFFYRARNFTGGNVVALRWQDQGLSEVWRTEPLAYVADFQVSELQASGEPMLVIATVSDFEGAVSKPRSFVVVTPLGR